MIISESIKNKQSISTNLPFTDCPWCGGNLFVDKDLPNIKPNHNGNYGINDQLNISCNTNGCTFHSRRSSKIKSLPLRLFDEDIYKHPPTLLFGTVDKFAALANNVSTIPGARNKDSRRKLLEENEPLIFDLVSCNSPSAFIWNLKSLIGKLLKAGIKFNQSYG